MNRILVPINFSSSSANALQYARRLAGDLGMRLTLLHCYPQQAFSRPFDFGKKDYGQGAREMLTDFYKKHVGDQPVDLRFIAQPGSVAEKVASVSGSYGLIVLSSNTLSSKLHRWMGSRTAYIASMAKCPVLIIPPAMEYNNWNKIWHIKRRDNETSIIENGLGEFGMDSALVEEKSFSQTTFKSALWRSVVAYVKQPKEELRRAILVGKQTEKIDLMILVSHQKDSFQKFVNDNTTQIIFQFNIPVLIFQE